MNTIKRFSALLILTVGCALAAAAQTNLTALDGGTVNIQGQRGKVVVLAVGASWLPLSAQQSDVANSIAKRYGGRDLVVYFIATDSTNAGSKNFASDDAIRKFAFARKLSVPVLRDPDGQSTLKKFGIEQVPSFVILDKNGAIVGEPFGGIDPKVDTAAQISKVIDKVM